MLEKEAISLQSLAAEPAGEHFVVRFTVLNQEARTLYAYGTVRRYQYDSASGLLTLSLHDQYLADDAAIVRHLPEPRFVPLEQNAETEIRLELPRVVHRIRSAAERQGSGPLTEDLPIAEATDIRLEVAHQDTPYYYNPARNNVAQLKEWGAQVASKTFKVKKAKGKGGKNHGAH